MTEEQQIEAVIDSETPSTPENVVSEDITPMASEITGDHHHSDTVELFGLEITVMGGIYTVVFGALAILTILEVIIAESFESGSGSIIALLSLAVAKAALVIAFYMHLKDDKRVFLAILLVPLLITALSALYLLAVPPQGY